MEKLTKQTRESSLHIAEAKPHLVIDVPYKELPEKLTCKVVLNSILGTVAFLAMLLAPAAVEGESYIAALVLIAVMAACAYLSIRYSGERE